MTQIEHLLRERIGLDANSLGSALIQRAVRLRMRTLGLKQADDYHCLLQASRAEWTELVEAVVVTETWFFRGCETFAALVRLVREQWLPAHPSGSLRLLSLPCSSGEEPYSIAMALLDAGVPAARFQIDAVDISARTLARARRGVYSKNSFRGKDLAFRDRYFLPAREGFLLNPSVRRCVRFRQDNVFAEDFLPYRAPYHFIFCRNLFIYFDHLTRQEALQKISLLLDPAGILFVGPAEQPLVLNRGFVSADIPMAFACRKASQPTPRQAPPAGPTGIWPSPPPPNGAHPNTAPSPASAVSGCAPPNGKSRPLGLATSAGSFHPVLDQVRQLADAGQLQAATAICEAHLRQNPGSTSAYYLMGLLRDAAGDESAVDYYRKALYLEPNHYETLLQMALLAQKNGDPARARTFKRRAERSKLRP